VNRLVSLGHHGEVVRLSKDERWGVLFVFDCVKAMAVVKVDAFDQFEEQILSQSPVKCQLSLNTYSIEIHVSPTIVSMHASPLGKTLTFSMG
jgi:hypothetical protein